MQPAQSLNSLESIVQWLEDTKLTTNHNNGLVEI